MQTKRTKSLGQFSKGTSGNPAGRPPGSRNSATVMMESLLEGEAEQLTRKAIEMALEGDITALRLCLERLIPPRKDRPIHLMLPPIENVQHISLAMAQVSAAIGQGEITPMEGEVLSNIWAAHKTVMVTAELERRVDELEKRMSERDKKAGTPPQSSQVNTNLADRLKRMEQRLGPAPLPIRQQVSAEAWIKAFSTAELNRFQVRWDECKTPVGPTFTMDIFPDGSTERSDVLARLGWAQEGVALEKTGKSYAELLREEAEEQK